MKLSFSFSIVSLLLLLVFAMGCQSQAASSSQTSKPQGLPTMQAGPPAIKQFSAPPPMTIDPNKGYVATMHTTMGDMVVDLFPKEAPKTVNNFVFLSREGFYKNVRFHRIMRGFMVQTGDPLGNGTGSPGYKFADEPVAHDYKRGIVAMANSGPNTNGSQFFIMHADYPLSKNYTIFGQVTDKSSLEVLDKIANVPVRMSPTGENSVPTDVILVTGVDIVEK